MKREYRSAVAFKQTLEQRIRTHASSGFDFARRRQLMISDDVFSREAGCTIYDQLCFLAGVAHVC